MKPGVQPTCPNRSMDASEALRRPGVVDVITAADIPGKNVRTMFTYEDELLAQSQVESQSARSALTRFRQRNGRHVSTRLVSPLGVLRWPIGVRCGRRYEGACQTSSGCCEDRLRRPARAHFHRRGQ